MRLLIGLTCLIIIFTLNFQQCEAEVPFTGITSDESYYSEIITISIDGDMATIEMDIIVKWEGKSSKNIRHGTEKFLEIEKKPVNVNGILTEEEIETYVSHILEKPLSGPGKKTVSTYIDGQRGIITAVDFKIDTPTGKIDDTEGDWVMYYVSTSQWEIGEIDDHIFRSALNRGADHEIEVRLPSGWAMENTSGLTDVRMFSGNKLIGKSTGSGLFDVYLIKTETPTVLIPSTTTTTETDSPKSSPTTTEEITSPITKSTDLRDW